MISVLPVEGRQIDLVLQQVVKGVFEGAGQDLPVEAHRYEGVLVEVVGLVAWPHPALLFL